MNIQCTAVPFDEIARLRDLYRHEMNCQIIHDSLHVRPGWTQSFLFHVDNAPVGYGAIAIDGPWKGKPTIFEFYVLPHYRARTFDLFESLMQTSAAIAMDVQSNDPHITPLLHTYARDVICEAILFHDRLTTSHQVEAVVRKVMAEDAAAIAQNELDGGAEWLVELDGNIVATGGILYHYNRPYGDIFMQVGKAFQRRGIGGFFVQELKRICYDGGSVPAARCNFENVASRKTLQKAGFVPCGNILVGSLTP